MMHKLHFLILILVFAASSILAQEGTLTGKVTNAGSQKPLTAVNVVLSKSATTDFFKGTVTNQTGEFVLQDVPYGEYMLTVSYVGYETYRTPLIISREEKDVRIALDEQWVDLGEIVVTSLHQEKSIKNVSMPMEVVSDVDVEQMPVFSPSEMLESQPGIALEDDGIWATSVNIRGLSEQRIVALVDGNRIETATDIAAGLSMIDMSELERVEIIKGASSSLYGTGAMGGVINFITKEGQYSSQPYTRGILQSEFHTVNEMYAQKFAVEGGNETGHFRIGGKIRKAGDVRTPEGILPNSQFQDHNISLDVGLNPWQNQFLDIQLQRFMARDVGIPGGEPFPASATATYPEEIRNMASLKYTFQDLSPALEEFSVKYFHQFIFRDVLLEPNIVKNVPGMRITPEKTTPTGKHYTNGIHMKSHWSLGESHRLIAGIDLWQRRLKTEREKYIRQEPLDSLGNPLDTIHLVFGETPIPESLFGSAGLFVQDEFYLLDEDLKVTLGGRYDYIRIHNEKAVDPEYLIKNGTRIETPPTQVTTFEEQTVYNHSWSANLGLLYHLTGSIDLTLNAGRSFRAPSIEERYKYIDLGNLVRLGDPDLKPEDGYSYDMGFRFWDPKFNLRVNGYYNTYSNLVVEQPGIFVKEYQAGTADTVQALINENVDQATIYGFDMQFTFNILKDFVIHGNASYVRGVDTNNDENLPLIPPLNGRIGLKHYWRNLGFVDLTATFYDKQNKIAENEDPTDGYVLFGVSYGSEAIDFNYGKLKLYGGVENLFDTKYRNHLSSNRGTLDLQPGRNIYLKMQLTF